MISLIQKAKMKFRTEILERGYGKPPFLIFFLLCDVIIRAKVVVTCEILVLNHESKRKKIMLGYIE